MGKSFMLSLSVTFVLVGLLYVFMKQKLTTSEGKLNTLFGVVQQLAGEIQLLKNRNNHAPPANTDANTSAEHVTTMNSDNNEDNPEVIQVSDDENESNNSDNSDDDSSDYDSSDDENDDDKDGEGERLTMEEANDSSGMKKEDVATMEISVEEINVEKISPDIPIENILSPSTDVELETDLKPMEINLEITPLDSDSAETSKIVEVDLDEDLSKLSVKELKGRVESINGPPLKTKKALIEYLNSKK